MRTRFIQWTQKASLISDIYIKRYFNKFEMLVPKIGDTSQVCLNLLANSADSPFIRWMTVSSMMEIIPQQHQCVFKLYLWALIWYLHQEERCCCNRGQYEYCWVILKPSHVSVAFCCRILIYWMSACVRQSGFVNITCRE